jgi:hypothetical protein
VKNPRLAQADSLAQKRFKESVFVYRDESSSIGEQQRVQVQYDQQFHHLQK